MHDVVIIGGGPAGMTAALYALRANRSAMILEKNAFGGQIAYSPKVENYPGTDSLSGSELADRLFQQVTRLGCRRLSDGLYTRFCCRGLHRTAGGCPVRGQQG